MNLLPLKKTEIFKGGFSQNQAERGLWKMRRAKEKRDIRPRICTAPSRFLAINKNGSEREELSSPPPMMVVIIALCLSPDKIQMCQNRIYNSFIIVQSDNSRSSIPHKLTTCTKTCLFFRQTRVCFRDFMLKSAKIALQIVIFMVI